MTDTPTGNGNNARTAARLPFPAVRLLYAIGFAMVAGFVFWIVVWLAVLQFVVVAVNGKLNDEIKSLSLNLVQYLWELLAFVTFVRDEQPFPFGPFPHASATPV
jgi:hypothetical protein